MSGLRSSQIATAAGVNLQTLRYYERRGLLAEPQRSLGGHRLYPPESVALRWVRRWDLRMLTRWCAATTL
ncbi:MerR family DNA-binding transcriptional regulator [Micromonospora sp. KC606]|uniref:MerR family DNA-binding transcriptional regulator n=1 Tax=Micromonospora sp. KC606 TaxID=2530379 RepID=UPI001FB631CD|nr:MerR family DNA-binding transcriptional regulator [Micromonospora sp. KC606]